MSKNFTVLNTVNTALSNKADFIIHAAGCEDCDKGAAKTCERDTITAENVAAAKQTVKDDLVSGGFEEHQAEFFIIIAMPCAA